MGMIRDRNPHFRKWVVSFGKNGYVIEYRRAGDMLFVTRVWHSREDRP